MEEELNKKLEQQDQKLNAIYVSVEKTRKYFLAIIWITVIAFVLPLIGLIFVVPTFLKSYLGNLEGLI